MGQQRRDAEYSIKEEIFLKLKSDYIPRAHHENRILNLVYIMRKIGYPQDCCMEMAVATLLFPKKLCVCVSPQVSKSPSYKSGHAHLVLDCLVSLPGVDNSPNLSSLKIMMDILIGHKGD